MTRQPQRPKTLRADARALLANCPGLQARSLARRLTQRIEGELEKTGLTLAQIGLLAQIASADDDRLGALAERTGLEQSTLSRNLRLLAKGGLVEIATVEKDLRRRAVWLTETGARRLEAALPAWRRAQERLSDRIDAALLAEWARSIDPVTTSLPVGHASLREGRS